MEQLTKPCSYCENPIPDSGVFELPTYNDIPENHKTDCPIREIMEVSEYREKEKTMKRKLVLSKAPDWKLLFQQKKVLLYIASWGGLSQEQVDALDGIINFIDSIQDSAVDENGFTEEEVFGFTKEA